MIHLKAGQNTALTADSVRFTAQTSGTVELGALVVGEDLRVRDVHDHVCASRPAAPGVSFAGAAVDLTLSQLRSDAHAVLLFVAGGQTLGAVTASLYENGSPAAEFVVAPTAGESALICLEVYRRGGGWKLRALGQGYAGGTAQLLTAHGVTAPEPAPAQAWQPQPLAPPSAPTETVARPVPASGIPLEVDHGLQRMWMIFEDAARSAAALVSARDYATKRLDQELSEAVSNPATRNTPAADAARAQAQRRHDDLVALADADHRRDSDQLGQEIAEADAAMPAALASWLAPAWTTRAARADGIRLGELYALDRGGLRVPYCVPVPLNRPLWVDTESTAAASRVVGALVARLVAAIPDKLTKVDLIDLTGGLRTLAAPSRRCWRARSSPTTATSPPASPNSPTRPNSPTSLTTVDKPYPHRTPHPRRRRLPPRLPGQRRSAPGSTDGARRPDRPVPGHRRQRQRRIRRRPSRSPRPIVQAPPHPARHPLFDPWTGNAWELDLDMLPAEPELQARYLRM